jgi:tetratricopeptide (TPR) repeat protein
VQGGLADVPSLALQEDEPSHAEGSPSMKGPGGTPMSVADFRAELAKAPEKQYAVSGDERLLAQLPRGNWVGGTIPYLMTEEQGGLTTRDLLLVHQLPRDERVAARVAVYDAKTIAHITEDAPRNGYTVLMIPAFSEVHLTYGKDAPGYKDLFSHPIVGWITGIDLKDQGEAVPKVFNGKTGEVFTDKALACHLSLPAGKAAAVEIVNIFERSDGPDIRFESDGFSVTDCWIDGKQTNFARWLTENEVDTRLPLIANYGGALINVSIQSVDEAAGKVALYAPVFKGRTYRRAKPLPDYVQAFRSATAGVSRDAPFACNCILNFLYGRLEGAHVGLPGPFTFGEIAFQLLNQTMVYCEVVDAGAHKVERPLVKRPTENLEAYQLYLKGRYLANQYFSNQGRGVGLAKALECFQQALALDERFALAHAGVAEVDTLLAFLGLRPPKEVIPDAKAAAQRALAVDDTLAEAHTSLGFIHLAYDWDWAAAERELQRAIALNPRYVLARYWYATLCASRLRLEESITEDERAVAVEPMSGFANTHLALMLLNAGRTAQAIAQLGKAIELDPQFILAHWLLGCAHTSESRYPAALSELEQAVELSHRLAWMVAALAVGYGEAGRTEEARRLLEELRARARTEYVRALHLAGVCAALGDTEEAFAWLERACEERDVALPLVRVGGCLPATTLMALPVPLRSDPRYRALLRKVGME